MLKVASCTVGRTVVSPNFFGLMRYYYCIIMGLCSASSAIMVVTKQTQKISGSHIGWDEVYRLRYATVEWQKHSGQTSPHAGRFYGVRGVL